MKDMAQYGRENRRAGAARRATGDLMGVPAPVGRVRSPNAPRYAYYLTPKGFAEKSHLAAEYLTSSFAFSRRTDIS